MATDANEQKQEKVYPGNIGRYLALREARESLMQGDPNFFAACIAEELAGLAYILDGVRYSARQATQGS